jgi:uncharacterized protein (TIGR03086 family)
VGCVGYGEDWGPIGVGVAVEVHDHVDAVVQVAKRRRQSGASRRELHAFSKTGWFDLAHPGAERITTPTERMTMERNQTFATAIDIVCRLGTGFAGQVEAVSDDRWERSTPCSGWAVRDLVAHVVSIVGGLESLATGTQLPPAVPRAEVRRGAHVAAGIRTELAAGLDAWRLVDLEDDRDFPWGRTPAVRALQFTAVELAGHGWDLMAATGLVPAFRDDDLEAVLATAVDVLPEVARPGLFDPPVRAPGHVTVFDRMAAALGRSLLIRTEA